MKDKKDKAKLIQVVADKVFFLLQLNQEAVEMHTYKKAALLKNAMRTLTRFPYPSKEPSLM